MERLYFRHHIAYSVPHIWLVLYTTTHVIFKKSKYKHIIKILLCCLLSIGPNHTPSTWPTRFHIFYFLKKSEFYLSLSFLSFPCSVSVAWCWSLKHSVFFSALRTFVYTVLLGIFSVKLLLLKDWTLSIQLLTIFYITAKGHFSRTPSLVFQISEQCFLCLVSGNF